MMDALIYYAGMLLKRAVEATGRTPTARHYLVAAWLQAQEESVDLEKMVQTLILLKDYEHPSKEPLDKNKVLRELGYYD